MSNSLPISKLTTALFDAPVTATYHDRLLNIAGALCGLRIWLFFAATLGILIGCGRGSTPTLKVANWAGPEEIAIEESNLEVFRQAHPGLKVILEPIPRPGEYKQKILTSIAGGTAPDVFLLDAIHVSGFIQARILLDLMPSVRKRSVDLHQFYPEVLSIAQRGEALFALPKDFTPLMVFCNRRLFEEAGIPYPNQDWTWDDFLELAKRLTRDTDGDGRIDRYGTVAQPRFFTWPPWVWSNGGDFLDPSGRMASGYLDGEPTVEALRFLLDLNAKHGVAADHASSESMGGDLGMFLSGRAAMAVSGHWWMPQIKRSLAEGKVDLAVLPIPVPRGGRHVTVLYESGWAVCTQTRDPDLAAELTIHLSSEEANRRRAAQGVAIPAHRTLSKEITGRDASGLEKAFLSEIPFARNPWGARVAHAHILEKHAEEAFANALLHGLDLREALREAARRIDADLRSIPQ